MNGDYVVYTILIYGQCMRQNSIDPVRPMCFLTRLLWCGFASASAVLAIHAIE